MQTVMARPSGREPVVFGHAVETLLAAAEPLSPVTLAALERLGVSPVKPLRVAYPGAVWPELIRLLAGTGSTSGGAAAAEYALGVRFIERSRQSRLGAALHDFAQVVGAERMLLRMTHNVRSTNNYIEATVAPRSEDTGWELHLRPVAEFARTPGLGAEPPHFLRGLLTTAFQLAGATAARVELLHHDPVRATTTLHVLL